MAFDSASLLYVVDRENERVQWFDLSNLHHPDFISSYNGGYLGQWSVMPLAEHIMIYGEEEDIVHVVAAESSDAESLPIVQYSTTGALLGEFFDGYGTGADQYWKVSSLSFDYANALWYLTDEHHHRVQVYDANGEFVESIGGFGSGLEQFHHPRYARMNYATGELVVTDTDNHRLHLMGDGVRIMNLINSADVINIDNSLSLVKRTVNPTLEAVDNIAAELHFGDYIVSDFSVNLSENRDWSSVNAITLPNESKSLIVNLNPSDAPGVSETHSLYVVKQDEHDAIRVCTEATTISDIGEECEGYTIDVSAPHEQLSTEVINGVAYWRVDGLYGTGILAFGNGGQNESGGSEDEGGAGDTDDGNGGGSNSGNPQSSTSGSSNRSEQQSCHGPVPASAPDLFQIDVHGNTAKLFFTPVNNTSDYHVSFSTQPHAEEHGETIALLREGVQSHTVYHLRPNTTYYFKVSGRLGCQSGEWSQVMEARTSNLNWRGRLSFYKYSLQKQVSRLSNVVSRRLNLADPVVAPAAAAPEESTMAPLVTVTKSPQPSTMPIQQEKKQFCLLWWCW